MTEESEAISGWRKKIGTQIKAPAVTPLQHFFLTDLIFVECFLFFPWAALHDRKLFFTGVLHFTKTKQIFAYMQI